MKSLEVKLLPIGNARGIPLPAAMIRKHHLDEGVVLEERNGEIVLRSKQVAKPLSWEETAQQMAATDEDWSDWEAPLTAGTANEALRNLVRPPRTG